MRSFYYPLAFKILRVVDQSKYDGDEEFPHIFSKVQKHTQNNPQSLYAQFMTQR